MITFLIAGILVGAVIGICVGYLMFNGDDSDSNNSGEQTYWFYIDFNEDETGLTNENAWISATGDSLVSALKKAFEDADMDAEVVTTDYGTSISYIEGAMNGVGGLYWMEWVWVANIYESGLWGWAPTAGLENTAGSAFYFGFTSTDSSPPYAPSLIPNDMSYWKGDGPFPAV